MSRRTVPGGLRATIDAVGAIDDEMTLDAAYQKRILRYLVFIGGPFMVAYGVLAVALSAPWYVLVPYLLSIAILAAGYALLVRPVDARRFLGIYRTVSISYVASLLTAQVVSLAVFNRVDFAALILVYPSLLFLFMGRKDGLPSLVACGLAYFPVLFLSPYAVISPVALFTLKVNLLVIFIVVAACTYFIDTTRRRFQSDLVSKQQETLRMKLAAEQASRAKSEFLGNMSHELRTPLNHIIGFTELLLESAEERHDTTGSEYLADVLESGRHLLLLVSDALDLARVEEGKLALNRKTVSSRDLLERSVRLVSDRGRERQVAVTIAPDAAAIDFPADPVRLTQVLVNLLVNAVKFTPSGGSVTTGCRLVDGTPGRRAEFFVSDTGIGIPAESIPLLFERFSRLETPGRSGEQGVGIGLALSKGLVEHHGGRIWVESDGAGKGSTFRFQVPAG